MIRDSNYYDLLDNNLAKSDLYFYLTILLYYYTDILDQEPSTTPLGSFENPATSCNHISQDRPSGEYWVQPKNRSAPFQVFCDTISRNCSCNSTGGWARVANLDMTDPSQRCPDGFREVSRTEPPLRLCGRLGDRFIGHVSVKIPTHGIEYTRVCGKVIGYQFGHPDAFLRYSNWQTDIDDCYADGVILTHGRSPRHHIWTFAAAIDARPNNHNSCPCVKANETFPYLIPPYIGQDYFCDAGNPVHTGSPSMLFPDDPLWDGQGCGDANNCCEFNNPPWFCKQLPEPTSDNIELRLCSNPRETIQMEDAPLEKVEIYIN